MTIIHFLSTNTLEKMNIDQQSFFEYNIFCEKEEEAETM